MRLLTKPGAWLGFLGTLSVAFGTLLCAYLPYEFLRIIGPLRGGWLAGRYLILAGIIATTAGFISLRPSSTDVRSYREYLPVLVLWCIPLVLSPPVLSRDAWAYMDQGWIVHSRFDPYLMGMGNLPGPYERVVDQFWLGTTTVYPPLTLRVQEAMITLAGYNLVASLFTMKLPGLLSMAAFWLLVPRLAARYGVSRRWAAWLALFNPIVIVHLLGGMHNDALMIALALAALWVAPLRWGLVTGSVLAGLSTGMKQQGLWAAVVVGLIAARPGASWGRRVKLTLCSVGIAVAVFCLSCLLLGWRFSKHGFGWLTGSGSPMALPTFAVLSVIRLAFANLGIHLEVPLMVISVVGTLAVLGWLYIRKARSPLPAAAWGWLGFCAFSPSLHSWYLLVGLTPLAATRIPTRLGAVVAGWTVYLMTANYFSDVWQVYLLWSALIGAVAAVPAYLLWRRFWPTAVE